MPMEESRAVVGLEDGAEVSICRRLITDKIRSRFFFKILSSPSVLTCQYRLIKADTEFLRVELSISEEIVTFLRLETKLICTD